MRFTLPLLVVLAVVLAGVDQASAASSRRRNIAAEPDTVYMAARGSLAHLRFHITSGSMSEHAIEAYRVSDGKRISATVRIRDGLGGGSDLVVQLSQVALDDSGQPAPGAKPGPLPDNSLSDAFFQGVEDQVSNLRR
jgi:hypothetical protein